MCLCPVGKHKYTFTIPHTEAQRTNEVDKKTHSPIAHNRYLFSACMRARARALSRFVMLTIFSAHFLPKTPYSARPTRRPSVFGCCWRAHVCSMLCVCVSCVLRTPFVSGGARARSLKLQIYVPGISVYYICGGYLFGRFASYTTGAVYFRWCISGWCVFIFLQAQVHERVYQHNERYKERLGLVACLPDLFRLCAREEMRELYSSLKYKWTGFWCGRSH